MAAVRCSLNSYLGEGKRGTVPGEGEEEDGDEGVAFEVHGGEGVGAALAAYSLAKNGPISHNYSEPAVCRLHNWFYFSLHYFASKQTFLVQVPQASVSIP